MTKMFYLIVFTICCYACNQLHSASNIFTENKENTNLQVDSIHYHQLYMKANESKIFCQENNYNTDYCLLINLSKHSGKKRFYLWDFEKGRAIDSGMVSHGCIDNPWGQTSTKEKASCSNVENSHASSLGNYKIGERGVSEWGIKVKYTLYGLDKTNSNAYKRIIVLHSWNMVSKDEIYPDGTPEGWGCPATSDEFLKRLDTKLRTSKSPVLLKIFQ